MAADYHIHSCFSGDSGTPPEENVLSALETGLSCVCFTEHLDMDYPYDDAVFDLDAPAYFSAIDELSKRFSGIIEIRKGVELGLQPHLGDDYRAWLADKDFDFIIGSTHLVDRMDPYYPDFWVGRDTDTSVRRYLEVTLENILSFDDFDVYGHIDYIIRYVPGGGTRFDYKKYADETDMILRALIERRKGIEINTGGFRAGLPDPNPCADVLRRYRELGGEIVTLGSDAHTPGYVGYRFGDAEDILRSCGFKYFTVFRERKPYFEAL